MNVKELCLIATAVVLATGKRKKKKRKRRKWVKLWLANRDTRSHVNLNELKVEPDDYRNYLRMNETLYMELLHLVTPLIERQDTRMRKAITPHERLSSTLRFLATGRSFEDLKYSTIISPQSLGKIIPETCRALCIALKDYIKFPTTENEWKIISEGFRHKWNFSHCAGAVDGKHVRIVRPPHSSSYFYNYKGFHSLVLLAIVDSNYEFILTNFGINGRVSDGGVIENTQFYKKLKSNDINLPDTFEVGGNSLTKLPFVFVGDEAFALRPDFLKPFAQKDLTFPKKIFNYRLSRARNVVENAFGILASRFRIFHTEINLQLRKTEMVVLATCALNNFLRRKSQGYLGFKNAEIDDTLVYERERQEAFADLRHGHNRHAGNDAKQVTCLWSILWRKVFMEYFMEEGEVPWQHNYVLQGNNNN